MIVESNEIYPPVFIFILHWDYLYHQHTTNPNQSSKYHKPKSTIKYRINILMYCRVSFFQFTDNKLIIPPLNLNLNKFLQDHIFQQQQQQQQKKKKKSKFILKSRVFKINTA